VNSVAAAAWANVVVTASALVAAGWAAVSTHRTLGIERGRDQKRDMAEEASQAAKVAAWAVRDEMAPLGWRITVVNNSAVPVYGAGVTFHATDRPDDEPMHRVGVLPPGTRDVPLPAEWVQVGRDGYGNDVRTLTVKGEIGVSIYFTDAVGMGWKRSERGALEQVYGHDSMRFLRRTVWPGSAAGQ
jgi:hypothetical protein